MDLRKNKRLVIAILCIIAYAIYYFLRPEPDQSGGIDGSKAKTTSQISPQKYLVDDHPCKEDISIQGTVVSDIKTCEFISGTSLQDFITLVETAYRAEMLSRFMEIYSDISTNKFFIKDTSNPKFLFVSGVESFRRMDYENAKLSLQRFIGSYGEYQDNRDVFFIHGCHDFDLDWILDAESHLTHSLADIMLSYINDIEAGNISDDKIIKYLDMIDENDSSDDIIDIAENIQLLILTNSERYNLIDRIGIDVKKLQKNSLNLYSDNQRYVLASQIDFLVIKKILAAQSLLYSYSWDTIESIITSDDSDVWFEPLLYSVMHLVELGSRYNIPITKNTLNYLDKIISFSDSDDFNSWREFYVMGNKTGSKANRLTSKLAALNKSRKREKDDALIVLNEFTDLIDTGSVDSSDFFIFVNSFIGFSNYNNILSDKYTGGYLNQYEPSVKISIKKMQDQIESYDLKEYTSDQRYDHINMLKYFSELDTYQGDNLERMLARVYPGNPNNECIDPVWRSLETLQSIIK